MRGKPSAPKINWTKFEILVIKKKYSMVNFLMLNCAQEKEQMFI